MEKGKEALKKPQGVIDREAEEAAIHRANLLRSSHKKRHWSSSSENDSEASGYDHDPDATEPESESKSELIRGPHEVSQRGPGRGLPRELLSERHGIEGQDDQHGEIDRDTIQRIRKLRKKSRHAIFEQQDTEITAAIHTLGASVAQVADKMGSQGSSSTEIQERLRGLEERLEEEARERKMDMEHSREVQQEGNFLLSRIMSKLDNM